MEEERRVQMGGSAGFGDGEREGERELRGDGGLARAVAAEWWSGGIVMFEEVFVGVEEEEEERWMWRS